MPCRRCGAMMVAGTKFCPACGTPVQADALPLNAELAGAPAPAAVQKSTNGLAIASMILGILWIYWLGSILALIFGYVAKGQINQSGGRQGGKGMAIAGIVLGWVGVGVGVVGFVLGIVAYFLGGKVQPGTIN